MSGYIRELPSEPTFIQKGFKGYRYLIENTEVEINYIDVTQGHDNYEISNKCSHFYYVLEGEGIFEIGGEKYEAKPNMFIEIPPHVEFCYTGNMNLLLIMNPPWFEGDGEITRPNPNVK